MGREEELRKALNELTLCLLGEEAVLPKPGLWPMKLPGLLKRNIITPNNIDENILKFAVGIANTGSAFALYWLEIEGWWNNEASLLALC